MTHLLLIFVNKKVFFQEYIEIELKIFFIIFEGFFDELPKQSVAIVTFKQVSITCR